MIQKTVNILTTSWTESLENLKPQTIGRLILLSFRTLIQIYTALPFAWFFPTALCAGLLFGNISLIYAFYLVLIARAARPSLEYKRTGYWAFFTPADWIVFAFVYVYQALSTWLAAQGYAFAFLVYHIIAKAALLEGFIELGEPGKFDTIIPFLSPFIIVWVLFMLDTQKTVVQFSKSFFRAVGMTLYNYPFFLITYCVVRLILAASFLFAPYLNYFLGLVLLLGVLLPLYIAFITNFYVKRLHEQFSLYYKD